MASDEICRFWKICRFQFRNLQICLWYLFGPFSKGFESWELIFKSVGDLEVFSRKMVFVVSSSAVGSRKVPQIDMTRADLPKTTKSDQNPIPNPDFQKPSSKKMSLSSKKIIPCVQPMKHPLGMVRAKGGCQSPPYGDSNPRTVSRVKSACGPGIYEGIC